ncbi:MAG TPA: ATP-binding protein [Chloroflexota bacterium]|nr:ATP-binding protein [Chloroflexota bacterium]
MLRDAIDRAVEPARRVRYLLPRSTDPTGRMFSTIRRRLTLWYIGILAAALVFFGVVLYLTANAALLNPIHRQAQDDIGTMAHSWQVLPGTACLVDPHEISSPLWACYNSHGQLVNAGRLDQYAPPFVGPSAADQALAAGSSSDTIGGGPFGTIERTAVRVSANGQVLGIVQVGVPVGPQLTVLHELLTYLLAIGGAALFLAAVGGLFLSAIALHPARLAYRRQREFVADAAHELRTPLSLLHADADVLLRGRSRLDPGDVELVEDMVTETNHLTALANHLLDLARLDVGQMPLEQDVIDLAALAMELTRRAGPLAAEKGVSLHVDAPHPILVIGDRLLIEEAALVLLDNAIKYNHEGGDVHVRARRADDRAHFEVRDTGIGVSAENLPHLGERFFRVDKARSRQAGGAGLGISIARTIAERHGGRLRLASALGEGTEAALTLPAAGGGAVPATDAVASAGPAPTP